MLVSRRTVLQQMMSALALQHGGDAFAALWSAPQNGKSSHKPEDFLSFGVNAEGRLLDAGSFYRVPASPVVAQDRLSFDVSNNRISCSIGQRGSLERFAIVTGVSPVETKATPVGAYVEKMLLRHGALPFRVSVGPEEPVALEALGQPEIHLEHGLFPRFEWKIGETRLSMLVFAPQDESASPRAICMRWSIAAADGAPILRLHLDSAVEDARTEPPWLAVMVGSGGGWESLHQATIPPGGITVAVLLEGTSQQLSRTRQELAASSGDRWYSRTVDFHQTRYGRLRITEDPFYAELFVRAGELARQSILLDGDGQFAGSFNGSDLPAAANVWMRDCFYNCLPQTLLCPDLSRRAIPFFLHWGIPSHPLGEHAERFAGASGVTNSLGNSVAGIVLSGMHFRHNDDRAFFLAHPEILDRSIAILDQVLASRREDVFLFPSIYVSDGESRGDFHTGSNIFLWQAFCSVARLAGEVYSRDETAATWHAYALRLREAILANCVETDAGGRRFVEGSMQDHTKIAGHDGEESDVTLAAFYDFCAPDDEAYLNAGAAAISPANPYFIPEVDGIWWYAHAKWSSATFPGWMAALSGSKSEAEMLRGLERIRTLADADGSFWWWPYPHAAEVHPERPARVSSKCGWAAGVYVCFFTRHILGLAGDAAKRRVTFHPFVPWSEFQWDGCRLGAIACDCSYRRTEHAITLRLRNRMDHALTVDLQALLPSKTTLVRASCGRAGAEIVQTERYRRVATGCVVELRPGEEAVLTVEFAAG